MSIKKQHSKQFKLDAVQYRKEHTPISVRLSVPEISVSAPVPFPAGSPNTGIIPVTFPPEVPVTIPPTSKRRLHVLRGNSVMHRMRLMS